MKKVYVIGTGTNGIGSLTGEALSAIQSSELLIGAKRMLEPYAATGKRLEQAYQPNEIESILRNDSAEFAAVLMSGDCGFFSGSKKLLPLIKDLDVTVLPGVSSLAAFCAKCGISYENMKFVSLHGISANIAINVKMNRYCFFLLGGNMTAALLCKRLCDYGFAEITVHIGANLDYKNETILHGKASDFLELSDKTLSVIITENTEHFSYIPSAICDLEFDRDNIPMTKAEVRCNVISLLKIARDAVCWDIGCGTGSVSVEMAFRCPDGSVFAFDQKDTAVCLTAQNAHKFSCDNVTAIAGVCPEILREYPLPDAVFIGGTGGNMKEIFDYISKLNRKIRVVLNAISLETLTQALDYFKQFCYNYDAVQISVARTKKVGSYSMLDAQNPVWLISGELKCNES